MNVWLFSPSRLNQPHEWLQDLTINSPQQLASAILGWPPWRAAGRFGINHGPNQKIALYHVECPPFDPSKQEDREAIIQICFEVWTIIEKGGPEKWWKPREAA